MQSVTCEFHLRRQNIFPSTGDCARDDCIWYVDLKLICLRHCHSRICLSLALISFFWNRLEVVACIGTKRFVIDA